jgi:Cytochrome bd terminal oxidase subunit I
VFALSFGTGVISGIVLAFHLGTNWSMLAEPTGSIQGPLPGYNAAGSCAGAAVVLFRRLLLSATRHHGYVSRVWSSRVMLPERDDLKTERVYGSSSTASSLRVAIQYDKITAILVDFRSSRPSVGKVLLCVHTPYPRDAFPVDGGQQPLLPRVNWQIEVGTRLRHRRHPVVWLQPTP